MNYFKRLLNNLIEKRYTGTAYYSLVPDFWPLNLLKSNGYFYKKQREYYDNCPPLSTCINKLSCFAANATIKQKDNLQNADIEKVKFLLSNPNYTEVQSDFLKKVVTYVKIHGFCPIWIKKGQGVITIKNYNKYSLRAINPEFIQNKANFDFYSYIRSFAKWFVGKDGESLYLDYSDKANTAKIPFSEIIIVYDLFFDESVLNGNSRVDQQARNILTHIAALDCNNSIHSNPDGYHIIGRNKDNAQGTWMDYNPANEAAKKELEQILKDGYGKGKDVNGDDKSNVRVVNGAVSGYHVKSDFKQFGTIETLEYTRNEICAAFGITNDVYGVVNSKYENKNEALKSLYSDELTPLLQNIIDSILSFFNIEKGSLIVDFSHLECFSDSEKKNAETNKIKAETLKILSDSTLDEKIKKDIYKQMNFIK